MSRKTGGGEGEQAEGEQMEVLPGNQAGGDSCPGPAYLSSCLVVHMWLERYTC
jgi:hypothetical protein